MLHVKVGDRLRNNDPRKVGEIVEVMGITHDPVRPGALDLAFAHYRKPGGRRNSVRLDRIAESGTNNNQGWTVLPREGVDVT
jgi:hypothetical protein